MKLPGWLVRPATLGKILGLSLAANLFLGGVVAGHFGAASMRPPPLFAPGMDNLFRVMPERERRAMRERLHANHPEVMEAHQRLRRLHLEIREEIGKDTPDRKLLEHKLHEVREGVELLEKSMHRVFLDTVLNLPAPDRRRILDDMRRQMAPPHPRPGGPQGSSPGEAAQIQNPRPSAPADDGVPAQ